MNATKLKPTMYIEAVPELAPQHPQRTSGPSGSAGAPAQRAEADLARGEDAPHGLIERRAA